MLLTDDDPHGAEPGTCIGPHGAESRTHFQPHWQTEAAGLVDGIILNELDFASAFQKYITHCVFGKIISN